jgi:pimeloyl-ACP methyl ester carboxylesterase
LADVRVPVHIFAGQHDPAVGIALLEGTTQRHLPQAEVEVLANSGHYPMFEVPAFLAARLESLLAV